MRKSSAGQGVSQRDGGSSRAVRSAMRCCWQVSVTQVTPRKGASPESTAEGEPQHPRYVHQIKSTTDKEIVTLLLVQSAASTPCPLPRFPAAHLFTYIDLVSIDRLSAWCPPITAHRLTDLQWQVLPQTTQGVSFCVRSTPKTCSRERHKKRRKSLKVGIS